MSIPIIDQLRPLGNFPAVDASDVQAGNQRLSTVLSNTPTTTYVDAVVENKVDKVEGKGLSTNDYTTAEKNKLSGIEANANNYVHPTTAGNKHIPSGGSAGKILGWASDGTAQWVDDQSLKNDYVTPEMYGAKGDGTTDDTDALQDAVDSGMNVKMSRKTYIINGRINIGDNVKIFGDETIIKSIAVEKDYCFIIDGSNVTVQGITFLDVFRAIEVPNSKFLHLKDLKISTTNFAIRLKNSSYFVVEDIYLEQEDVLVTQAQSNYPHTDGVHINGNSYNGVIRNITGTTCDDMISLCAYDGFETGNINNILIDGVITCTQNIITNYEFTHTDATFNAIRIYNSSTSYCDNIVIKNVNAKSWFNGGVFVLTEGALSHNPTYKFYDCRFINISDTAWSGTFRYALDFNASPCRCEFHGCEFENTSNNSGLIQITTQNEGSDLYFDKCTFKMKNGSAVGVFRFPITENDYAVINSLNITNSQIVNAKNILQGKIRGNLIKYDNVDYKSVDTTTNKAQSLLQITDWVRFKDNILTNSRATTGGFLVYIDTCNGANVCVENITSDNENALVQFAIPSTDANNTITLKVRNILSTKGAKAIGGSSFPDQCARINSDGYFDLNITRVKGNIGDFVNVGNGFAFYDGNAWINPYIPA